MPQLIQTPEGWFRVNRRDLHLIVPAKSGYSKKKWLAAQKELHAWFADHLPLVPLSILGPSEYSGWIEGGPRYLVADFDSCGIAAFNAAWKEGSFWKIETWLFSDWLKRVESANLLSPPVSEAQKIVRWWDTPEGILMLNATTMGPFVDVEPGEHTLSLEDGWWRMQQLFPEFSGLKAGAYPCGFFRRSERENVPSMLAIKWAYVDFCGWDSHKYENDAGKIRKLKEVIGISDELPLEVYVDDFG